MGETVGVRGRFFARCRRHLPNSAVIPEAADLSQAWPPGVGSRLRSAQRPPAAGPPHPPGKGGVPGLTSHRPCVRRCIQYCCIVGPGRLLSRPGLAKRAARVLPEKGARDQLGNPGLWPPTFRRGSTRKRYILRMSAHLALFEEMTAWRFTA